MKMMIAKSFTNTLAFDFEIDISSSSVITKGTEVIRNRLKVNNQHGDFVSDTMTTNGQLPQISRTTLVYHVRWVFLYISVVNY